MDREAWWATNHVASRVGYNLATELPPNGKVSYLQGMEDYLL